MSRLASDMNNLSLSQYADSKPSSASSSSSLVVPCPCVGLFGAIEFCQPIQRPGSKHPAWFPPKDESEGGGIFRGLRVNNSLTGTLEDFRPARGNQVTWYTCGPTVYDACHMGHARAYLTLDITRRIMEDYFGYEVLYQINITDIDDKIILRARQNHLLAEWKQQAGIAGEGKDGKSSLGGEAALEAAKLEVAAALDLKRVSLGKKRAKLAIALPADAPARDVEEREEALKGQALKEENFAAIESTVASLLSAPPATSGGSLETARALVDTAKGELGELLDERLGSTVSDHAIFNAHSRQYEQEFLEDMDTLGVRPPDILTRVTEYVSEIAAFVAKIVAKGLGYAANGSVYLSIDAFKAAGHSYRKLKPFSGDTSEADMAEGEGAIGAGDASEKRNKNDFALWKKSKPGEPSWPSPWGQGRPGWHIECSVIASDILGPNLDVHAGGVDLKFPHHDNELAQSEAYYGHGQWVNYFFHAGHLSIKGLKMSKSLKNFITIRQALEKHSARQIRLMFLLQPWDRPMNYSDQTMDDAKKKEAMFRSFFGRVKQIVHDTTTEPYAGTNGAGAGKTKPSWLAPPIGWRNKEAQPPSSSSGAQAAGTGAVGSDKELMQRLVAANEAVHRGFCTNFDTPAVLAALTDLVSDVNKYLAKFESSPAALLLRKIATFVTRILRVLGVVEGSDDIGFPLAGESGSGSVGKEETLRPYLDALRDFRHEVRARYVGGAGKGGGADPAEVAKETATAVLQSCDKLRDEVLPPLGVRLEDPPNKMSIWKLDDPAVLLAEIEDRREKEMAAAAAKKQKVLAAARKKLDGALAAMVPPCDFFKSKAAEFSVKGDSVGADFLPTHGANGEELTKSAVKKLKKLLDKQTKDHEKLHKEAGGAEKIETYIAELRATVAKLEGLS